MVPSFFSFLCASVPSVAKFFLLSFNSQKQFTNCLLLNFNQKNRFKSAQKAPKSAQKHEKSKINPKKSQKITPKSPVFYGSTMSRMYPRPKNPTNPPKTTFQNPLFFNSGIFLSSLYPFKTPSKGNIFPWGLENLLWIRQRQGC